MDDIYEMYKAEHELLDCQDYYRSDKSTLCVTTVHKVTGWKLLDDLSKCEEAIEQLQTARRAMRFELARIQDQLPEVNLIEKKYTADQLETHVVSHTDIGMTADVVVDTAVIGVMYYKYSGMGYGAIYFRNNAGRHVRLARKNDIALAKQALQKHLYMREAP